MAEVCDSLRQLTLLKAEWTWNASYQELFDEVKSFIKEDTLINFDDEMRPPYMKTDGS